jgi:hypothetical protein
MYFRQPLNIGLALRPAAVETVPRFEALTKHGAEVVSIREPQFLLHSLFYISSKIPRVTPFEVGLPGQYRRWPDDQEWEEDLFIMDERFVAVNVRGKDRSLSLHALTRTSSMSRLRVRALPRSQYQHNPLDGLP